MKKKKKQEEKNIIDKKTVVITLLLLLTVPISVYSVFHSVQYLTKAQGFTYKVIKNHQLTCEEQVTWGNHAFIYVKDEAGKPIKGAKIEYWHDYQASIKGKLDNMPPTGTLTTDGSGMADFDNRWPGCLGCPKGGDHRTNFFFRLKDAQSDTAVEVTSGYFGDECGKQFCPGFDAINVWGHWAYEIVFQKKAGELLEEEVPTDHAGQSRREAEYQAGKCRFWDNFFPYESYNPRRGGVVPTQKPIQPTQKPIPTNSPLPQFPTTTDIPQIPSPTGIPTNTLYPTPTTKKVYPTSTRFPTKPAAYSSPAPTKSAVVFTTPTIYPSKAIPTPTPTQKPSLVIFVKSTLSSINTGLKTFFTFLLDLNERVIP